MENQLNKCKSSPISKFYGENATKKLHQFLRRKKHVQETADKFGERPLPIVQKSSVFKPSSTWKKFTTQKQAVDFANKWSQFGYHVFAVEKGDEGKREYIVSTYDCFWTEYLKLKPLQRNHYEVISPYEPCNLYFDLEYPRETNCDVDEEFVLQTFIQYICSHISFHFGIHCNRNNILDLTSSTEKKFSRHLIFHLPGAVFPNNLCCGRFVYHACRSLQKELDLLNQVSDDTCTVNLKDIFSTKERKRDCCETYPEIQHPISKKNLESLIVKDRHGMEAMLCDLGVYTRYRNFRLYMSTKVGKKSTLLVSPNDLFTKSEKYSSIQRKDLFDELVFRDSLICSSSLDGKRILEFDCKCSPNHLKIQRPFDHLSDADKTRTEQGYQSVSPFPSIDSFVEKYITKKGTKGRIRRWIFFPDSSTLIYDIDGNRWCENIGREHKSNHVYYVVDLIYGVMHQKCHDPDCQMIDFKSRDIEIPVAMNPLLNQSDLFIDDFESSIEDVLNVTEEVELDHLLSKVVDINYLDDKVSSNVTSFSLSGEKFKHLDYDKVNITSADSANHTKIKEIDSGISISKVNNSLVDFDSSGEAWEWSCFEEIC